MLLYASAYIELCIKSIKWILYVVDSIGFMISLFGQSNSPFDMYFDDASRVPPKIYVVRTMSKFAFPSSDIQFLMSFDSLLFSRLTPNEDALLEMVVLRKGLWCRAAGQAHLVKYGWVQAVVAHLQPKGSNPVSSPNHHLSPGLQPLKLAATILSGALSFLPLAPGKGNKITGKASNTYF